MPQSLNCVVDGAILHAAERRTTLGNSNSTTGSLAERDAGLQVVGHDGQVAVTVAVEITIAVCGRVEHRAYMEPSGPMVLAGLSGAWIDVECKVSPLTPIPHQRDPPGGTARAGEKRMCESLASVTCRSTPSPLISIWSPTLNRQSAFPPRSSN